MLKQIFYTIVVLIFAFSLFACQSSLANDINLDDLSSPIDISTSTSNLKLTRGTYTYTLTKKAVLNNKRYVVYGKDNMTFTSEHKASPEDAYCKFLEIIPADDKAAVRAMNVPIDGPIEIKTEADMGKAQQMIADTNRLNSVKFVVGILPLNDSIKDVSRQIRVRDTIIVSGVHFKHSDVVNNGQKEPLTHCLANTDVFYLTRLEIE